MGKRLLWWQATGSYKMSIYGKSLFLLLNVITMLICTAFLLRRFRERGALGKATASQLPIRPWHVETD